MDENAYTFNSVSVDSATPTGREILDSIKGLSPVPQPRDQIHIHEQDYVKLPADKATYVTGLEFIVHRDRTEKVPRLKYKWFHWLAGKLKYRFMFRVRVVESTVRPGAVLQMRIPLALNPTLKWMR